MLVFIAVGWLFLYYVATCILAWSRLRKFPGPPLASFSFLWLLRVAFSNKAFRVHMKVRESYGPGLIRVAPDTLISDDPEVFRRINGAHNGYSKGDWYSVMRLDPYQHSIISSPVGANLGMLLPTYLMSFSAVSGHRASPNGNMSANICYRTRHSTMTSKRASRRGIPGERSRPWRATSTSRSGA